MAFDPNYATNGLFYVFYTGTAAADGQDGPRPRRRVPRQLESERRQRREPPAGPDDHAPERGGRQPQRRAAPVRQGRLPLHLRRGRRHRRLDRPEPGAPQRQDPADRPARRRPGRLLDPAGQPLRRRPAPRATRSGPRGSATRGASPSTRHRRPDHRRRRRGRLGGGRPGAGLPALGRGAELRLARLRGLRRELSRATTPPVFAYPHTDPGGDVAHGCAIIGGYVYRGTQIPELAGRYLYADLCTGELRSIKLGIPFAGGDRAESAPGRPDRSAVVRRGRELQPLRHERQRGGQARRPAVLRDAGLPGQPDQVQEEEEAQAKKHHAAAAKKDKKHKKKNCQKKKHKKKKKRK